MSDVPPKEKVERSRRLAFAVIRQALDDYVTSYELIIGKRDPLKVSVKDAWCIPVIEKMPEPERIAMAVNLASINHKRVGRFLRGEGENKDIASLWFAVIDRPFFNDTQLQWLCENWTRYTQQLAPAPTTTSTLTE